MGTLDPLIPYRIPCDTTFFADEPMNTLRLRKPLPATRDLALAFESGYIRYGRSKRETLLAAVRRMGKRLVETLTTLLGFRKSKLPATRDLAFAFERGYIRYGRSKAEFAFCHALPNDPGSVDTRVHDKHPALRDSVEFFENAIANAIPKPVEVSKETLPAVARRIRFGKRQKSLKTLVKTLKKFREKSSNTVSNGNSLSCCSVD